MHIKKNAPTGIASKDQTFRLDFTIWKKLTLAFIFFTIVGTLSHEIGHLIIARLVGYNQASINYQSSNFSRSAASDSLGHYLRKYKFEIANNLNFTEQATLRACWGIIFG